MSHEVETMAFAHDTPWHGLGVKVDANLSPAEMLKAAGLDWDVVKTPLMFEHQKQMHKAGNQHALIRETDGEYLTTIGAGWQPLNNRKAFEFFNHFVGADKGGATMETAGSLQNGKIVWGLANLNQGFVLKSPTGAYEDDPIKGYLLLVNPHQYGKSITGGVTPIQVVCANTLRMALSGEMQSSFRHAHNAEFDPKVAAEFMSMAHEQFVEFQKNAELLIKLNMSWEEAVKILAPVYQGNVDDVELLLNGDVMFNSAMNQITHAINESPGAKPGSAWGVLHGVTYYTDHLAGRGQDSRLFSAWMGTEATRKQKVLDSLLEAAGA